MRIISTTISDEEADSTVTFTQMTESLDPEDTGDIVQRLANAAHGYLHDEIEAEVDEEDTD